MHPFPTPILALDAPSADAARVLLARVGPGVEWVKVGLQLFTAAGPDLVRALRDEGLRVFLDLKLHDIPHTVEMAVRAAAGVGAELLTVHASGGAAMLRAARLATGEPGRGPQLFAVTVLTSLADAELRRSWGTAEGVAAAAERLAGLAAEQGMDGVVCSVAEVERVRAAAGATLRVLTPGIRLAGDAAGDQTRIATPGEAARCGADYVVIGRSVTAAADPAGAWARVRTELCTGPAAEVGV